MESNDSLLKRNAKALEIAFLCGQLEESHHKAWVIDQMVRALAGSEYYEFVETYRNLPIDLISESETYEWDIGIAP